MARKPDLTTEEQHLKALIREAHEVTQSLRAAIREANQLYPTLVADFEKHHRDQIKQLSNYFTQEINRHNSVLNDAITEAREAVNTYLMSGEAVFHPAGDTVTIRWAPGGFPDSEPLPYPSHPVMEKPQ